MSADDTQARQPAWSVELDRLRSLNAELVRALEDIGKRAIPIPGWDANDMQSRLLLIVALTAHAISRSKDAPRG
jgi:hypothetical protein